MLEISAISHTYPGSKPLSFPNLMVKEGEKVLISGESGSGKTSLLHIAAGLLKPTRGIVVYKNLDLYRLKPSERDQTRGRDFGIIFQKAHLVKNLTVIENLLAAMYFAGYKPENQKALSVLEKLNLSQEKNKYPHMLSQGQAQRAAVAKAVINKPNIIFADEPTSSLDDKNTAAVVKILEKSANELNAALIVSSHDNRLKPFFENVCLL